MQFHSSVVQYDELVFKRHRPFLVLAMDLLLFRMKISQNQHLKSDFFAKTHIVLKNIVQNFRRQMKCLQS